MRERLEAKLMAVKRLKQHMSKMMGKGYPEPEIDKLNQGPHETHVADRPEHEEEMEEHTSPYEIEDDPMDLHNNRDHVKEDEEMNDRYRGRRTHSVMMNVSHHKPKFMRK